MTVEHMLQTALLACEQTSVCPQQTLGTFQHLLRSLVHLSSSSSALADLNPLHFRSHPAAFCCSLFYFSFHSLSLSGFVVQFKKHLCSSVIISQGHQSHGWVFKVGRIKVLLLRLTLKDVGFTLGWRLWLSRLGLNESTVATYRHHANFCFFA